MARPFSRVVNIIYDEWYRSTKMLTKTRYIWDRLSILNRLILSIENGLAFRLIESFSQLVSYFCGTLPSELYDSGLSSR